MAVSKRYECDIDGEQIDAADVLVVRVGTLANRPDEADRFEVGPCCWSAGPLLALRDAMIMRRAERGLDMDGNPLPEVEHGEQTAEARA